MIFRWFQNLFASKSKKDNAVNKDQSQDFAASSDSTDSFPVSSQINQWMHTADILYKQNKLEEAAGYYRKVLSVKHDSYASYYQLGKIYKKLGDYTAAEDNYKMAVHYNPGLITAYIGLGDLQLQRGSHQDAVAYYLEALNRCKEPPVCATLCDAIAKIYYQQRDYPEASRYWKQAAELDGSNADYLQNLGIVLNDMGLSGEAEACIRKACLIDDQNPDIFLNLSWALLSQSRFDEADKYCNDALALDPENEAINNHVARILIYRGHEEEALTYYCSLIEKHPDYLSTRQNMAMIELQLGKLDTGWQNYEVRKIVKNWKGAPDIPLPASIDDFIDRNVLILTEQGLGDEILFSSCLPDLMRIAASVGVCCDKRLASLFQRSFPGITLYSFERSKGLRVDSVTADVQELLGSLPRFFRPTVESFPDHNGYLVADEHKLAYWQERLANLGAGPKIGIAWRSLLNTGNREGQYTHVSDWSPILKTPGVHFVNLQYDECADELAAAFQSTGVRIADFTDLDQFNDLDGVAALMTALDVVITPCTSVGELAGALGRPVWKLSRKTNWTMLGTGTSPWYPATRIFIQEKVGDWTSPINAIEHSLHDFIAEWDSADGDQPGS